MTPTIVAEVGAAHNGSFGRAIGLIDVAANAGADWVKFQCWSEMAMPGHIITDGPWAGRDLADLYEEAKTPWDWFPDLFRHAKRRKIKAFASVFDIESVAYMESLKCPMYKIASAEIVDLPLIRHVAALRKPVIISTGMATEEEIDAAVNAAADSDELTLLKCVSSYPAKAADANLETIPGMHWETAVGLSDHTIGSVVACVATALGVSMIEKHIGLDRTGLDGGFCTLPDDFKGFVRDVRDAAACLGEVRYGPLPSEASTLALRRSLWVVRDVKAGELVTAENVRSLRPDGGTAPDALRYETGRPFSHDETAGTPFTGAIRNPFP